jgi:hypothetical protein
MDKLNKIKPGTIYVGEEPEYYGCIPVRSEITVLPADEERPKIGWPMYEKIGTGYKVKYSLWQRIRFSLSKMYWRIMQ